VYLAEIGRVEAASQHQFTRDGSTGLIEIALTEARLFLKENLLSTPVEKYRVSCKST
jgi:hypothetical protein